MHFLLQLCTFSSVACVCFFYPCFFFRYFRLLIKDNSNNNCFFEYFFFFFNFPSFSFYLLCVCFFSLSFLLYCMVYYKKLFTSFWTPLNLPSPHPRPFSFSLFLFEIYHWISFPSLLHLKSLQIPPPRTLTHPSTSLLILNPSLSLLLCASGSASASSFST